VTGLTGTPTLPQQRARSARRRPPQYPAPAPSTGIVDDQDEPEDEQDRENEAAVRDLSDHTQLPDEFQRDDED